MFLYLVDTYQNISRLGEYILVKWRNKSILPLIFNLSMLCVCRAREALNVFRAPLLFCCSVVSDSLQPHGWQPARHLRPWNSPGKNPGVDCLSLSPGDLPDPGTEPEYWQADSLPLSHWEALQGPGRSTNGRPWLVSLVTTTSQAQCKGLCMHSVQHIQALSTAPVRHLSLGRPRDVQTYVIFTLKRMDRKGPML